MCALLIIRLTVTITLQHVDKQTNAMAVREWHLSSSMVGGCHAQKHVAVPAIDQRLLLRLEPFMHCCQYL